MSEELKPCPFCGGDGVLDPHNDDDPSTFWYIYCSGHKEGCRCDIGRFYTKEAAIAAWNRRAPSPDMREAVEALTRLSENIASFDAEVAFELSNEGERADLWTDIDVNVEDLRIVVAALRSLTGAKP